LFCPTAAKERNSACFFTDNWYTLLNNGIKSGLGGKSIVDFEPGTGGMLTLPSHKFRVGDAVLLEDHSSGKGKKDADETMDKLVGIVSRVQDAVLSVAFKQEISDLPTNCKISKLANDVSYSRMQNALKLLQSTTQHPSLVQVLLGHHSPSYNEPVVVDSWNDEGLNDSQRDAVKHCLQSKEVALIHGPPGYIALIQEQARRILAWR
jgi:DNA polymerase alpha-associated DNA helicase A